MESSTVSAFLTAFRTNLQARYVGIPALATVRVDLVSMGDTSSDDAVTLIARDVTGVQGRKAMGVRNDSWEVPGSLRAYATDPDSDVAFQAAWNRASEILDEIQLELIQNKPTVGLATFDALVTDSSYLPLLSDKGGWVCFCDFTVTFEALVN